MSKSLLNNISFIVAIVGSALAGLFYVMVADLTLGLGAMWLFIAIVLAFGSVVCNVLSDNYKEQRKTMYILKGVATVLMVVFVSYMFVYMTNGLKGVAEGLFAIKKYASAEKKFYCSLVTIGSVVLGAISVVGSTLNIILTTQIKDE